MSELHLRRPGFTYSACDLFTENKKITKKFKETRDSRHIYQNELDKAYGDFKDLNKRTASDKLLRDKAFNTIKNPKYDGHQRDVVSMV